ncbi:MAG: 16S rRNA (adenine(1518)-N(6)/adenine(1519)-N(6))-dimethyltransferase RsmA [Pseudomonadales bacterium]|nr:16S rRNA (adenine(1518)-N(6)/adenine(1519)-N(6))-dimethyltransferase RsmA [Pseudomonadales bacterium]
MRARKRFGQNFLTDRAVITRIVATMKPTPTDRVIEIGPGRGALTALLLESGCHLEAIEIDRDLIALLHESLPELNVIEADALKFDFGMALSQGPVRIVGNLPYNISTPLLFRLFAEQGITDMHFMLQKEVVERMTAEPGTRAYGRLSVMTRYYCEATPLFSVPPTAFTPRPKVTSAIVRLRPRRHDPAAQDTNVLASLLIDAFSQRRKTLRNALGKHLSEQELASLGIDPGVRPETLSVTDYVNCANLVTERKSEAQ